MRKEKITIDNIPAMLWGEPSKTVFIAVHGNMSDKEDTVIEMLAEKVTKSCQVLSFDLPEHGDRKRDTSILCNPQNCINDLKKIMQYAKLEYNDINLWACSMGAYFSMLAYKDEELEDCLFLSPVVNMKVIIDDIMKKASVTEEMLKEKREIKTDFGPTLYWDYYEFVKNNPVPEWDNPMTYILYGKNDDIQSEEIINSFCEEQAGFVTVYDKGEHFFHTDEQLEFYKSWLFELL
ncbi:MAG: alpha/beta hydrolase [Clostridia bacterium]|nr:alpha/beta hydrolase [Clostridia bacterium]